VLFLASDFPTISNKPLTKKTLFDAIVETVASSSTGGNEGTKKEITLSNLRSSESDNGDCADDIYTVPAEVLHQEGSLSLQVSMTLEIARLGTTGMGMDLLRQCS
jgi:hypothetical protein